MAFKLSHTDQRSAPLPFFLRCFIVPLFASFGWLWFSRGPFRANPPRVPSFFFRRYYFSSSADESGRGPYALQEPAILHFRLFRCPPKKWFEDAESFFLITPCPNSPSILIVGPPPILPKRITPRINQAPQLRDEPPFSALYCGLPFPQYTGLPGFSGISPPPPPVRNRLDAGISLSNPLFPPTVQEVIDSLFFRHRSCVLLAESGFLCTPFPLCIAQSSFFELFLCSSPPLLSPPSRTTAWSPVASKPRLLRRLAAPRDCPNRTPLASNPSAH